MSSDEGITLKFLRWLGEIRWLSGRILAMVLSAALIGWMMGNPGSLFSTKLVDSPSFRTTVCLFVILAALAFGSLYDALQRPRLPWDVGRTRKLGGGYSYPNPNSFFYLCAVVLFSGLLLATLYLGTKDEKAYSNEVKVMVDASPHESTGGH
jgi:hypothetical protein